MGSHQPIRKIVTPEIPDKLYFRIGDVARLCDVPAYVLRFWETEFPQLKPNKGGTGQRLYRKREVELALRIKSLLYDQGYTIPGARQVLKAEPKGGEIKLETTPQPAEGRSLKAVSAPQASALPHGEVTPLEDAGSALRLRSRLEALRKEMDSLLKALEDAPVVADAKPAATKSKVQAMRPRLAVEPTRPRLAPQPVEDAQRDLF
jgi:DNA-binding transcriptional MerR regulator